MNTKTEVGKRYRNVNTGKICKVTKKIFFNIQYVDEDDVYHLGVQYCHYKRFYKHWEEV